MKINKLPASIIYIIMICANLCFSSAKADQRGQVTNLPIPRFVSMKAPEGNVRRGPSLSHRVDWIFKQKNTPLKLLLNLVICAKLSIGKGRWLDALFSFIWCQACLSYRRPNTSFGQTNNWYANKCLFGDWSYSQAWKV